MATRAFDSPQARLHRIERDGERLVVTHRWSKELAVRALMILGGGLAAGVFLAPAFLVPAHLIAVKLLFGAIGGALGVLVAWAALLARPHRAHLELGPDRLEVEAGSPETVGEHPTDAIRALIVAGSTASTGGQGPGPGSQRLGVYVDGVGTVGLVRGTQDDVERIQAEVEGILEAVDRSPLPVWPVAPQPQIRRARAASMPAGATVETDADGVNLQLPQPSIGRRALAYLVGALPLALAIAGLAAVALLAPPASWHPFAVLGDPDALVLGIVSAWLVAAVPWTRGLVGRVHRRLGQGPYTLRVAGSTLTVLGRGPRVIDQVRLSAVEGVRLDRFGATVLAAEHDVRLPVHGLADAHARAWVAAWLTDAVGAPTEDVVDPEPSAGARRRRGQAQAAVGPEDRVPSHRRGHEPST